MRECPHPARGTHADLSRRERRDNKDATRFRVFYAFVNNQVLNGAEFVMEEMLAEIAVDARAPSPGARDARRPLPKGEAG